MFLCSKLPFLGWRSEDFLQGFFHQKCTRSSTKISMVNTPVTSALLQALLSALTYVCMYIRNPIYV
jgi:hypothetical protein